MFTLLIFLAILGILIFVHEFGHFFLAKIFKVKVEEFGFGFPPRIFSFKKGETIYSLNWIPLGGFVRIKGEEGGEKEPDSFISKKIWQRILIVSAGVLMNIFLTVFLFSVGYLWGFPQIIEEGKISSFAQIRNEEIKVVTVLENTPAKEKGIELGDVILEVDNQKFSNLENLAEYIDKKRGERIQIKIKRKEEIKEIELVPLLLKETGKGGIGVGMIKTGIVSYPFYLAFYKGVEETVLLTGEIFKALGRIFKDLFVTREVLLEVTGPIGIAVLTGEVARQGFLYILQFIALISLNLAIINFFPFPALDGGRFLFLMIEKIRKKPIDRKIEALIHSIGFALLMVLVILVTYQDILRFGEKFKVFFPWFKK